MLIWRHHMYSEEKAAFAVNGSRVTVGRSPECDIKLPSGFVADRALVFERKGSTWELETVGRNGCECAGRQLPHGARLQLLDGTEVRLPPYVLKIDLSSEPAVHFVESDEQLDQRSSELIGAIHTKLLARLGCNDTDDVRDQGAEYLLQLEHVVDELAIEFGLLDGDNESLLRYLAGTAVRNVLIDRIIGSTGDEDPLSTKRRTWVRMVSAVEERESDLVRLAGKIEAHLKLSPRQAVQARMARVELEFSACWRDEVRLLTEFYAYLAQREIKKQVKDILFGYGAIEDLLRLPTVSEIMVVGHEQIFVEKQEGTGGTIENSGRRFVSAAATQAIIERIVSRCNRRIDQSQPLVDARLDDGSRVNAVIAPVSVCGPCLTIRKFPAAEVPNRQLDRKWPFADGRAVFGVGRLGKEEHRRGRRNRYRQDNVTQLSDRLDSGT